VALGNLPDIGGSHAAQRLLLVGVDLGFGGGHVVGGSGLDLKENESVAVPDGQIEVSADALGTPAAGDDGVSETSKVEKGGIFAFFAGK